MKYFAYVFGVLLSVNALANGQVTNAHVLEVRADSSGKGYITFDVSLTMTLPSCTAAHHTNKLAFDVNTPGGQAIMSIGLTALASGKTVDANGTGSCAVYGIMEDWKWGFLKN